MRNNPLMKYAETLAVDIEKMCKGLPKGNNNTVFQIRKSSSSTFANITEAQYPQSLADMLSKFKIARKECAETESWLKVLFASGAIDEKTFKDYRNLCGRIRRILTASCVTIENKLSDKK
ncbi:MAG: four helix bundle protein [Clostridia bacterium]|nr:four helix bundle protein [Clostridia bacterium]MBQ6934120.1 four helix bundle protein [Clostridia bacterium]